MLDQMLGATSTTSLWQITAYGTDVRHVIWDIINQKQKTKEVCKQDMTGQFIQYGDA